ncbi:MAG: N-acetyltransferase family protein [Acidimicrobiia bacterium]
MIRPALVSDAADLASLHVNTWQHTYRGIFPEDFLAGLDVEKRTSWFAHRIESGAIVLMAEDDGDTVGFASLGESVDKGWGEVFAIYVHPDVWGNGHGFELLTAAEFELSAAGFDRALLWVLDTNTRARSFYERQDWTLGKPLRIEEIGGVQVTEVRYERVLGLGS